MLFMVIERFKNSDPKPVGERFGQSGRMLPDGLGVRDSWMDVTGSRCFQLMETADPKLFGAWVEKWKDLIDFEIVPVAKSEEFWEKFRAR